MLPTAIDHLAAQSELDAQLFPHYLLGRQLALEEAMREVLTAIPDDIREEIISRLRFNADTAMERLRDGVPDAKDEAATCGYVCTLLQQGF